jgi:hypothetical protein
VFYDNRPYDRAELADVMRRTYDELIAFVASSEFAVVIEEMNAYPPEAHPAFVKEVLLDEKALKARGVTVPEGILIQRSAFGDRRPTLFVVKKFLPEKYHDSWENVNITFDELYDDASVSREGELAWRLPLPVELQSQLMTHGQNLEDIPDEPVVQ